MEICLTGATGFVGGHLVPRLLNAGHSLRLLGRTRPSSLPPAARFWRWDSSRAEPPPVEALDGSEAIIHLAGAPVAQRWTERAKGEIRNSRVNGTNRLAVALPGMARQPSVIVAASAVGIYGSRGDEVLDESSSPGTGFLSELCIDWERASETAAAAGVRVVILRIGVVLGHGGGALARMLPAFKVGASARIGNGRQWMPWIHIEDLMRLIEFALRTPKLMGLVNATAPHPVMNSEFTQALANTLHRPAFLAAPGFALRLALGEMSQVLLDSQRVIPKTATTSGFDFRFPQVRDALSDLLR